jgi:hypothetical protein
MSTLIPAIADGLYAVCTCGTWHSDDCKECTNRGVPCQSREGESKEYYGGQDTHVLKGMNHSGCSLHVALAALSWWMSCDSGPG